MMDIMQILGKKFESVLEYIKWFCVGLWDETKETWEEHPAVLFWWITFAFFMGLIV